MAFSRFNVLANQATVASCIDSDPSCLMHHPSLSFLIASREKLQTPSESWGRSRIAVNQALPDPLALYLEKLASLVLDALSEYDGLSSPVLETHVAPSVIIEQQGVGRMSSRNQLLAFRADEMKHMPNFKFDIKHAVTQIHEGRCTATMWVLKRLSGVPSYNLLNPRRSGPDLTDGICKESVACTKWELRGKTWMCTRLSMIRGVAHGSNCES